MAKDGIRGILQNVCRGIRLHNLEALVAQTRFAVVSNSSRRDGHFVNFAGWAKAARDELPPDMTWRWMNAGVLWDMAMDGDLNLAVSAAEVVRTMFARRSLAIQRHNGSEGEHRASRVRAAPSEDDNACRERHSEYDKRAGNGIGWYKRWVVL